MLNGHDKGYQAQTKNNAIQHTNQLIERLYHYDKTGELTLIKDTRRGAIHYKYDPVGRLLEATSKLGKETFNFDPASNILDRYNSTKEQSPQHISDEKDYGYNRLVNNVVQEYLDQQYQYDAFGQLIRQKSSQGDLNLEWDVLGRLVRSRNNQYTAEYRYDALGRRIQKRSKHHLTGQEQNIIYGWDGDTLAYESSADITKHYFYEKDSFVPLLQAAYHHTIELHQTQDWTEKTYSIYKDPLWNTVKQSQGFDDVWFYHCDHLGTPQEMSNQTGAIVWKAQYKAWGECKVEQAKSDFFENSEIISNNIRFQGQYFDGETGLHYNRYRYYSPYVGRFISKDPIGLLGGFNVYAYAPNPNNWIDPLGLSGYTKDGKGNTIQLDAYGIPDKEKFEPNPNVTKPYKRPVGTTSGQRKSVQGKACVVCGSTKGVQIPDHKDALVVEYYRDGKNDLTLQNDVKAVQPHCRNCSSTQGGKASGFSKAMNKKLGF